MTQADANVELKPCPTPWCRGEGEVRSFGGFQVLCQGRYTPEGDYIGCGVEGPECATPEEAIAAWNTRVEPTLHPLPSEIEERAKALWEEAEVRRLSSVWTSPTKFEGEVRDAYIAEARTAMQRSTPTAPVQGDDAEWLRIIAVQGVSNEFSDGAKDRLERIASRLSGDNNAALVEAANELLAGMGSTFKARNGRDVGIEAGDGEKIWLVHSDLIETLRAALASITSTDADGGRVVETPIRDTAAIAWLMGIADTDALHALAILSASRNEEHHGDCTRSAITCNRCVCDEALEAADAALRIQAATQKEAE